MADTISSTELSRNLSEILSRVQHSGESFTVVRNGKTIAALSPVDTRASHSTGSWGAFAESVRHLQIDPSFANDLAEIQRSQGLTEIREWPIS